MAKWKVRLVSYDSRFLDSVVKKIVEVAKLEFIDCSVVSLPTKIKRIDTLRSPFIYKDAIDQYCLVEKVYVVILNVKHAGQMACFNNVSVPAGVNLTVSPIVNAARM